jgi:hypothetical protein
MQNQVFLTFKNNIQISKIINSLSKGLGGDNMTVILVCFLHGRPYDDLIERCKTSLVPGITSTPPTDEIHAGDFPDLNDDDQDPASPAKVTATPPQDEDDDNNEEALKSPAKATTPTPTTSNIENGAGDTNNTGSEPEPIVPDNIEITDSEPVDASSSSEEADLK